MFQAWSRCSWASRFLAVLLVCGGCSVSTSARHSTPDYVPAEVQLGNVSPAMSESHIDNLDRFVSTVRVRTSLPIPGQGTGTRDCSGVLIAPQLVLTAGHCVCGERKPIPPEASETTITDRSTCAKTTFVTLVRYGSSDHAPQDASGTEPARLRFNASAPYKGTVQAHEDLQIVYRQVETPTGWETNTEYSHADLAVIFLEKPVEEQIPAARLANEAPRLKERVLMAGFGAKDLSADRGDGERRYGENIVVSIRDDGSTFHVGQQLEIAPSYTGEKPGLMRIRGSYIARGDSGGPCFRERKGVLELVGIARSTHGPPVVLSVYTSTHSYLDWLHQKLASARSGHTD